MVKPLSLVLAAMLALSVPAGAAQEAPPPPPPAPPPSEQGQMKPPPPPPPPAEQEKQKPPPPPPAPVPMTVPPMFGQQPPQAGPNIRVEVTLSERTSDAAPLNKAVMITTSSGHWGRVRTEVHSPKIGGAPLNVDVKPTTVEGGMILLELRIEYQQSERVAEGGVRLAQLNESLTVRLDDGKPLAVTRSADADSDRSVALEVMATVLK